MDNKFLNLKKEYRDFINETSNKIKPLNIHEKLSKSKCVKIFNLFQDIHTSIESSPDLNINDINHILKNYNRDDKDVELIRKFIKIKNLYVNKEIINSNQWKTYIGKLNNNIDLGDDKLNEKKTDLLVAKGVYRLLNNFVDQFGGSWEITEFKDNKFKKIDIIEPEHFDFLKKYIINKIK